MKMRFGQCCALALFVLVGCKEGVMIGCRDSKLADDFEWINNTYNSQPRISLGHGTSGWYIRKEGQERLASGTVDAVKNDGCNFEIDVDDNPHVVDDSILSRFQYRFSLRDIDPDSVKVRTFSHFGGIGCEGFSEEELASQNMVCDFAELDAMTRNARPVVERKMHTVYAKLTGKDHEQSDTSEGNEVYLGFDDPEYAKKFADVFKDAVKRCGGTKGAAS